MTSKHGWIELHDRRLHYFDDPNEASRCGQQWIDETFMLVDMPVDELPSHTCERCLAQVRTMTDRTDRIEIREPDEDRPLALALLRVEPGIDESIVRAFAQERFGASASAVYSHEIEPDGIAWYAVYRTEDLP